jgi:RNA polymerase sigma-70 factor (ECF subfamily)
MSTRPWRSTPEIVRRALEPSDEELLASLRDGRVEGIARAYDRWHHRVRVLAVRLLGDEAAGEDVVQETFVALTRAVRRFRGEVSLERFVLAIAVKRARHHLRGTIRRRRQMAALAVEASPEGRDPEHHAYRRQLAGRLAGALDLLPGAQREAFVLCEVEEMTALEAAHLIRAPEATVRTRLFHARRRLRELLSEEREP